MIGLADETHYFGHAVKCSETGVAAGVAFVKNACCEEFAFGDTTTPSGGRIGCDGRGGVIGLLKLYKSLLSEYRGVEA